MTSDLSFALFDTAIGCCGIVWSARGIAGVQLPEKSEPSDAQSRAASVSGGA